MKTLLGTAAVLAVLSAPAFADPALVSPQVADAPARVSTHVANAFASYRPEAVVVQGQVVGQDPDQSIRFELSRDVNGVNGGN